MSSPTLQSEFSDLISHLLNRLRLKLLVQVEYEERGFLINATIQGPVVQNRIKL